MTHAVVLSPFRNILFIPHTERAVVPALTAANSAGVLDEGLHQRIAFLEPGRLEGLPGGEIIGHVQGGHGHEGGCEEGAFELLSPDEPSEISLTDDVDLGRRRWAGRGRCGKERGQGITRGRTGPERRCSTMREFDLCGDRRNPLIAG